MSSRSRLYALASTLADYKAGQDVGYIVADGRVLLTCRIPGGGYVYPCRAIERGTFVRIADEFGIRAALGLLSQVEEELLRTLQEEGVTAVEIDSAVVEEK